MTRIVITHDVVDVERWLRGSSERTEAIGAMGGSNIVDHVAHDDSSAVAICADVEDVGAVMAALASPSPELAASMESHGVLPPVTVYVAR
ncbi:MAG TPA: hypothetical protein VFP54_08180 [Acidimicrobiales bacterium]|nr:hypothetical protein [Acidimicrobiales bacterium]